MEKLKDEDCRMQPEVDSGPLSGAEIADWAALLGPTSTGGIRKLQLTIRLG
jgi:hypothetical protein